jgi:hypothetical protein
VIAALAAGGRGARPKPRGRGGGPGAQGRGLRRAGSGGADRPRGIGAAYRFPVVVEPDVQGTVTFEVHNATVGTVLEAICQPRAGATRSPTGDTCWSAVRDADLPGGLPADDPDRVELGEHQPERERRRVRAGASAWLPRGRPRPSGGQRRPGRRLASTGIRRRSSGGALDPERLAAERRGFLGAARGRPEGHGRRRRVAVVNRFAGLVQLRGSLRTHAVMEAYLRRVLQRVGRQARISVKVVEVDLNDQSKAGIDWNVAGASLGRIAATRHGISGSLDGRRVRDRAGRVDHPQPRTPSAGTISAGGVQAAISALSEQGTVRVESKPEVAALNNQTAFVQVSEDQPFFSRTSTTTINAGGTTQAGTQPIVSTNYSESTVSFGNVLEITVQIADDLTTKLSLSPGDDRAQGHGDLARRPGDGAHHGHQEGAHHRDRCATTRPRLSGVSSRRRARATSAGIPLLSSVPVLGAPSRPRPRRRPDRARLPGDRERGGAPGAVPVEVDGPEPRSGPCPAPWADPMPGARRVERIGSGGCPT